MARLVYELNQSLDGYVDHQSFRPDADVFRYFIKRVRELSGMLYGRRMYEVMRYWDDDRATDDADEQEYARVWRSRPKWVVSRTLKSAGPNATLIKDDSEAVIRGLKDRVAGEIGVAGPALAGSLSQWGLIDEYRIYLHPVMVGSGKHFFSVPPPPLRLAVSEAIAESVLRLSYVPA